VAAQKQPTQRRSPAKRAARTVRAAPATPASKANGIDLQREVEALLYRQSEALDNKEWKAFIDLFAAAFFLTVFAMLTLRPSCT